MTKGKKLQISVIILLVLITVTIAGLFNINGVKESVINTTCVVENHEMIAGIPDSVIDIDRDGEYTFELSWNFNSTPGFVTRCTVVDENDNYLFDITGDIVESNTIPLELKKGSYRFTFDFFNSESEWEEYLASVSPEEIKGGVFTSYDDGSWDAHIRLAIKEHNTELRNIFLFLMLTMISLDLVAVLLIASKNSDKSLSEYDERQMLARGKAFQYAFITLVTYSILVSLSQMLGIDLPVIAPTLSFWGISLSIIIFCTIAIWQDAYFALNENRTSLLIIFSIITVVNLIILISTIVSGSLIINGRIDYGGISVASCVMFVWLFVMLLAKSIREKKEED